MTDTFADRYTAACVAVEREWAPLTERLVARHFRREDLSLDQTGGMVFCYRIDMPLALLPRDVCPDCRSADIVASDTVCVCADCEATKRRIPEVSAIHKWADYRPYIYACDHADERAYAALYIHWDDEGSDGEWMTAGAFDADTATPAQWDELADTLAAFAVKNGYALQSASA